jgi:hypothetical protein
VSEDMRKFIIILTMIVTNSAIASSKKETIQEIQKNISGIALCQIVEPEMEQKQNKKLFLSINVVHTRDVWINRNTKGKFDEMAKLMSQEETPNLQWFHDQGYFKDAVFKTNVYSVKVNRSASNQYALSFRIDSNLSIFRKGSRIYEYLNSVRKITLTENGYIIEGNDSDLFLNSDNNEYIKYECERLNTP